MASGEPELLGAGRLRELLATHGVRPTKVLGQNFVIDPNTIRKVVSVAGVHEGDRVLEIGAGAGSLTLALAGAASSVVAVEVDPRLTPVLHETVGNLANVEVVEADALELPLGDLAVDKLVANLPYNIAVPVVMRVLQEAPQIRELVVMTQREVGERLAAEPGSKAYGQVSVLVAYFAAARVAAKVSRRAFFPVPGVDSVLVRIERREPPPVDRRLLFAFVKAAFSQRRKTLRNALVGSGFVVDEPMLEAAGVPTRARAEELRLADFVSLVESLVAPPAGVD